MVMNASRHNSRDIRGAKKRFLKETGVGGFEPPTISLGG